MTPLKHMTSLQHFFNTFKFIVPPHGGNIFKVFTYWQVQKESLIFEMGLINTLLKLITYTFLGDLPTFFTFEHLSR